MYELLLLLLPVAAATGWLAGRRGGLFGLTVSLHKRRVPEYIGTLDYSLDEQPDKVIDRFIRIADVDSETVEAHLALGNLFRQRGEVERAIRVHQSLIDRSGLSPELRSISLLELACDYMSAGWLDRAESIFKKLMPLKIHQQEALNNLTVIYERENEWHCAIETNLQLQRVSGQNQHNVIAHYYCEIAALAAADGRQTEVQNNLQRALKFDPECARANVMQGQLAFTRADYAEAIRCFRQVERQDPSLMPIIAEKMLESFVKTEDEQALSDFIEMIKWRESNDSIILAVIPVIEKTEGFAAAQRFAKNMLIKQPTLKRLHKWVELELRNSKHKENIHTIVNMLDNMIKDKAHYSCSLCGFRGKDMHWQCPSCQSWSTVKPLSPHDS